MALTKLFLSANSNGSDVGASSIACTGTYDSTGYNHLVLFVKHEQAASTMTPTATNTTTWNSCTQESHTNGDLNGQFHWAKINTPGAGQTFSVDLGGSRVWRVIIAWLVNADSGVIELDAQTNAEGSSNAPDAGSLATTGVDVLSFFGIGPYTFGTMTATGWGEDQDGGVGGVNVHGYSRGPETTTPIDPLAAWTASDAWVACAVSLREVSGAVAATRIPFVGSFGRRGGRRNRYPL